MTITLASKSCRPVSNPFRGGERMCNILPVDPVFSLSRRYFARRDAAVGLLNARLGPRVHGSSLAAIKGEQQTSVGVREGGCRTRPCTRSCLARD